MRPWKLLFSHNRARSDSILKGWYMKFRDVNWRPEIWFENRFYFFDNQFLNLFCLSFLSWKLHKNYQMSDKVNWYICLMLSVYKCFHETVKYGQRRNYILQDLTGLHYTFLWRPVKQKTVMKRVFNNQKPVYQNKWY